ncbi:MAG: PspC domain-containing protein [Candidatus Adiutrix sp.]|jgi:phage shock protein C|nr:PspC domain-containing protein [Candidatus Adiutrix sp.]
MSDKRFEGYASRGFTARLKTCGPFRSDDGVIFGVARGLAEYFGWPVGLTRLIMALATVFLFFWPTIILYLAAALLMSPAPKGGLGSQEERDIWFKAQMDPNSAMDQLAKRAGTVEKRLRRLEDYVTSKEFLWRRRMGE